MKKKGFTLVEIMAVIAIIAILAIVAMPNIVKSFNNSKENTFLSEAQGIYKSSTSQYVLDSTMGGTELTYSNDAPGEINTKTLDIEEREGFKYTIKFNEEGDVYYFNVRDGSNEIEVGSLSNKTANIKLKDIKKDNLKKPGGDGGSNATNPSNPSGLTCTAGYYNNNGTCTVCPENTYSLSGANSCTACPATKCSDPGSTSVGACVECEPEQSAGTVEKCSPGYGKVNGTCTICPRDTYSMLGLTCEPCGEGMCSNPGSRTCRLCPDATTQPVEGTM